MEDQPNVQPAEELTRPLVRAGKAIAAEIGARTTPTLLESQTPVLQAEASSALRRVEHADEDEDTPSANLVTEAKDFALGAIAKTGAFIQDRASRPLQQTFERAKYSKTGHIITRGLAGAAIATTAVAALPDTVKEKPATMRFLDQPPSAKAAETDMGTGGYPFADAEPGSEESYGLFARECESYVHWKLLQQGVNPDRAMYGTSSEIAAKNQFEKVDNIPAAGAVARYGNHVIYIESVDGDKVTYSDYNGSGGPYMFGIRTVNISDLQSKPDLMVVHTELPPVANGDFIATGPDERMKDAISQRNNGLFEGKYIRSEDGRYILLFNNSNLAMYDTQNNFAKVWESKTAGKGGNVVEIEIRGKNQSNRLVIRNEANKVVWQRSIGKNVNKLSLGGEGENLISLFAGNKKVAEGSDIDKAAKAAQAIDRKKAMEARKRAQAAKRRALAAKAKKAARKAKRAKGANSNKDRTTTKKTVTKPKVTK